MTRRTFVAGVGAAVGAGSVGLAGCLGRAAEPDDTGGAVYVPVEPNYRGWFDNVSTYKRTVDRRGEPEVRIQVGTRGDVGNYKFDPPAVAVSPGTRVVWEWTGKGGPHNVVAEGGVFDSGAPLDDEGHTFAFEFPDPGIYTYVCEPHRTMGMKGAVFVSLGPRGA